MQTGSEFIFIIGKCLKHVTENSQETSYPFQCLVSKILHTEEVSDKDRKIHFCQLISTITVHYLHIINAINLG